MSGVTIKAMSKTVSVADLAADVAALLHEVVEKQEEVVVTQDGRVIARVLPEMPAGNQRRRRSLEELRGSVTILGDIVEPLDVEWDATK